MLHSAYIPATYCIHTTCIPATYYSCIITCYIHTLRRSRDILSQTYIYICPPTYIYAHANAHQALALQLRTNSRANALGRLVATCLATEWQISASRHEPVPPHLFSPSQLALSFSLLYPFFNAESQSSSLSQARNIPSPKYSSILIFTLIAQFDSRSLGRCLCWPTVQNESEGRFCFGQGRKCNGGVRRGDQEGQ